MKKSERIALGSVIGGIVAGGGLWLYTKGYFSWWVYWIVGAIVAGGLYQNLLRMMADESVVDSRTINRK